MLLCFFWGGWDVVNAGMTCHDSGSIQMALSRIEEVHVPELFFSSIRCQIKNQSTLVEPNQQI